MLLPPGDAFSFAVPATPFADQGDRQQFRVTTGWFGTRTGKEGGQWGIQVAGQHVHPRAKVLEIGYHQSILGLGVSEFTVFLPNRASFVKSLLF